MRRVEKEIEKAERDNGKTSNQRQHLVPDKPVTLICTRVPRGLLIDFYDPSWFNSHTAGHKTLTADAFNVAFLPNASESLRGIQHPNERLGDWNFTQKYWDQIIEPYDISHKLSNEEDLDTSGDSDDEIDDDSEVVSSEDKTDKDEVAQEVGESNQIVDQDTKMEHSPKLSNPFGPSEISFQNEWSGW
ncbi:hypothetical protein O181_009502 [Austropuccinia psidii MF-1]|uniref:Uncharacterized protein n=1 Tax=Austropuccinia psidii MF-1 TaxID=1389203 RepID=A0A9Q3BRW3_9BASI|nr:hypothetical protein [Austropuccinia psidii MF-1]